MDNVGLALLSVATGGLDSLLGATLLPGGPVHHLGHDETLLEVGVDATGGLWRRCTALDDPRLGKLIKDGRNIETYSDFIRTSSEEVFETESLETICDNFVELGGGLLTHLRLRIVVSIQKVELVLGRVQNSSCTRVDFVNLKWF